MWPFHNHDWEVVAKTYAPPFQGKLTQSTQNFWVLGEHERRERSKMILETEQMYALGVTSVLLKCKCGRVLTKKILGKESKVE